jgi:hypothetical protein
VEKEQRHPETHKHEPTSGKIESLIEKSQSKRAYAAQNADL